MLIIVIAFWAFCGYFWYGACGEAARRKGYDYQTFAVFGFAFMFLTYLVVMMLPPRRVAAPQEVEAAPGGGESEARDEPVRDFGEAADTLLKYKELLDAGAVTQEEFDAAKARLLGTGEGAEVVSVTLAERRE
jgi:hypothetical protein